MTRKEKKLGIPKYKTWKFENEILQEIKLIVFCSSKSTHLDAYHQLSKLRIDSSKLLQSKHFPGVQYFKNSDDDDDDWWWQIEIIETTITPTAMKFTKTKAHLP